MLGNIFEKIYKELDKRYECTFVINANSDGCFIQYGSNVDNFELDQNDSCIRIRDDVEDSHDFEMVIKLTDKTKIDTFCYDDNSSKMILRNVELLNGIRDITITFFD